MRCRIFLRRIFCLWTSGRGLHIRSATQPTLYTCKEKNDGSEEDKEKGEIEEGSSVGPYQATVAFGEDEIYERRIAEAARGSALQIKGAKRWRQRRRRRSRS
jgi:hypothetical protein